MSKSRDEKIKLTANLLNTGAASSFTVGVVAPIVAVFLNLGDAATKVPLSAVVASVLFWSTAATIFHVIARKVLEGLDQ